MAIFLKRLEHSNAKGGGGKFLRVRCIVKHRTCHIYRQKGMPPLEVPATYEPRSPTCWNDFIRKTVGKYVDPAGTWYVFERGGSFTSGWKLEKKNMKPKKLGIAKLLWKGEIN
jgi:hypothetical protein